MGMILREDDVYIASFIDLFNLRFAPAQDAGSTPGNPPPRMWDSQTTGGDPGAWLFGGIAEMAALQREFQIFRAGRPFWQSAALLGVGGFANNGAKNRWLSLLMWLTTCKSDNPAENGDQRIVNALIANLGKPQPLPCYMQAHDLRDTDGDRVIVRENDRPLFYIDRTFLTISLPMAPRTSPTPAPRKRAAGRGGSGPAAPPSQTAAPRKRPRRTGA